MEVLTKKNITIALVVSFGLGLFVGTRGPSDPTDQTTEVMFGDFGLKIDTSQRQVDHRTLLENLFANDFGRAGLMSWLGDKDIFSFDDDRLTEALNKRLCVPIPEQPLDQKIKTSQDCADLPVAIGLRQLADQKRIPFHYVGITVQVGIPAREDQPQTGGAHICADSALRGKRVELTNPLTSNRIEVHPSGTYECTGFTKFPDIQLSFEDAQELFSGPLYELQEAVAVGLN